MDKSAKKGPHSNTPRQEKANKVQDEKKLVPDIYDQCKMVDDGSIQQTTSSLKESRNKEQLSLQ